MTATLYAGPRGPLDTAAGHRFWPRRATCPLSTIIDISPAGQMFTSAGQFWPAGNVLRNTGLESVYMSSQQNENKIISEILDRSYFFSGGKSDEYASGHGRNHLMGPRDASPPTFGSYMLPSQLVPPNFCVENEQKKRSSNFCQRSLRSHEIVCPPQLSTKNITQPWVPPKFWKLVAAMRLANIRLSWRSYIVLRGGGGTGGKRLIVFVFNSPKFARFFQFQRTPDMASQQIVGG